MECIDYEPNNWDLLIPTYNINDTLCVIRDKTNLFVVSIVRLIIYIILLRLYDENGLEWDILRYGIQGMIGVCVIYILIILRKDPLYRKRIKSVEKDVIKR